MDRKMTDDQYQKLIENCEYKHKNLLRKAIFFLDQDDFDKSLEILKHLIQLDNKEALFLASTFGTADEEWKDYEIRQIKYLKRAAKLNQRDAIFSLGVCYDTGDGVTHNSYKADKLFRKSALLGHPRSLYIEGTRLYFNQKGSREEGRKMIYEAAKKGVSEAKDLINSDLILAD